MDLKKFSTGCVVFKSNSKKFLLINCVLSIMWLIKRIEMVLGYIFKITL